VTRPDLALAEIPLALLAGGTGTRVQSISHRVPKALFEVNGRPFIAHQLELLRRHGVRRVVICSGHLGEQTEAFVGNGRAFGLEVAYSRDGEVLLGTGGALKKAEPLLGPLFWVMYGDTYLDVSFAEVLAAFRSSQALGLMTVFRNDNRFDRSNVAFRQGALLSYDKRQPTEDMTHIDYGLSLLRHDALAGVPPATRAYLGDLYHELAARGAMKAFEVHRRFYEIGSPEGLAETRRFLAG
jgi:N-acetyl-alpha-D-muramate 1-phosphate uridylyltransferase